MLENRELTNKEAIQDCKIINDLILSILKDGVVQDSGDKGFPSSASFESKRLEGVYGLMDKYTYGWYFTVDVRNNRLFTKDEQLENLALFQQYILSHVGDKIIPNVKW